MEKQKTVNERQAEFYNSFKKNKATRIWYKLRNSLFRDLRKSLGAEKQVYELHKQWLGDLSDKKVLDLGCYAGNSLSYYLAENSADYLGIDLSKPAIDNLGKRLSGLAHARVVAIDFLSEEFSEKDFDLIYAYGVLHHFEDTDELIKKLKEKLVPGGKIISYDPLQTSLPVKIIRSLYRPFQSDKEWEWPFTKRVVQKYKHNFDILDRRAIFGQSKWIFLLRFLPISRNVKDGLGKKWHLKDWERSKDSDKHLFSCMHLTMLMKKK